MRSGAVRIARGFRVEFAQSSTWCGGCPGPYPAIQTHKRAVGHSRHDFFSKRGGLGEQRWPEMVACLRAVETVVRGGPAPRSMIALATGVFARDPLDGKPFAQRIKAATGSGSGSSAARRGEA